MTPLALARLLYRRYYFLLRLKQWVVGVDPRKLMVHKGQTHICIEGYPRSANTFAYFLFLEANPQEDTHIAHHTHAPANIARALRYMIPVVALIRNPVDAVTSSYIFGPQDLDYQVQFYISFYRWLKPRKHKVVLAPFDVVTRDLNEIINQVNSKYNVSFNALDDIDTAKKRVLSSLRSPDYYHKVGRVRPLTVSGSRVPSEERDLRKEQVRPMVLAHRRIDVAQALYQDLTARSSYLRLRSDE